MSRKNPFLISDVKPAVLRNRQYYSLTFELISAFFIGNGLFSNADDGVHFHDSSCRINMQLK